MTRLSIEALTRMATTEGWPIVGRATMAHSPKVQMGYTDGGRTRKYILPVYNEDMCETVYYEIPNLVVERIDDEALA